MFRFASIVAVAVALCACGNDHVVVAPGNHTGTPPTGTPPPGSTGTSGTTCKTDCDCGAGSTCAPATSELGPTCQPGKNTCPIACATPCGQYQKCDTTQGVCVNLTCPSQVTCGPNDYCDASGTCQPKPPEISVNGVWQTSYVMDISSFAQQADIVLTVLDLLSAIFNGSGSCANQQTSEGQLLCYILQAAGANVQAPPWVGQLLTTLEDLFKFGSSPVTATGQMTLTQGANDTLSATETWSSLWMEYNGQQLDLMNSPVLGASGNVTVTVDAFGGTRDYQNVYLGPRDVEFDVDKFIIALVDVAINAATNGQASDLAGLMDLAICSQLGTSSAQQSCSAAAQALLGALTAESAFGGFHIDHQDAPIIDSNGDGVADSLASPTAPASLLGSMSNGILSGDFGATSHWYGVR